jgi:hypothetical protein
MSVPAVAEKRSTDATGAVDASCGARVLLTAPVPLLVGDPDDAEPPFLELDSEDEPLVPALDPEESPVPRSEDEELQPETPRPTTALRPTWAMIQTDCVTHVLFMVFLQLR